MIAGLVLAAGASRRLGRPKQLLPLGGKLLLARAIETLLAVTPSVVVVLGYEAAAIQDALDLQACTVVYNPAYAQGMSTSLRCGLQALGPAVDAALITTVDQPLVTAAHLQAVITAYCAGGTPIMATDYGAYQGVPLLLARRTWPLVDQISGDQGARALLRAHPDLVALVPAPDAAMALDIDTEAEYQAVIAQLGMPAARPDAGLGA